MNKIKADSIFISDMHLGHPYARSKELLSFLKRIECQNLFIVGDGIDFWVKNKKWTSVENAIVQKVLKLSRKGTNVYYIYGNHDERLREIEGESFGNIHFLRSYQKDNLFVFHGDVLDFAVQSNMKWLAKVGAFAYNKLIWFNYLWRKVHPKTSISQKIKRSVKDAVAFINNFETMAAALCQENNCKVVICGHIHSTADKLIGEIRYLNCGDWLEDATYIVQNGEEYKIIRFNENS